MAPAGNQQRSEFHRSECGMASACERGQVLTNRDMMLRLQSRLHWELRQ